MEKNFKNKLQKLKLQKGQNDPLLKTFEGSLFRDSSWYLDLKENDFTFIDLGLVSLVADLGPKIEILFVGDTSNEMEDDLLGKMIIAMKLKKDEYFRYNPNTDFSEVIDLAKNLEVPNLETQDLFKVILTKRPKIVISLGASVTNILLGRREKLSAIHGQFIAKKNGDFSYQLVPLFHPDFLKINPNMKRTAWNDLQKVMEVIGKI